MSSSEPVVRERKSLLLPDGRRLAVCEAGDPDGAVTFYLHGTGGSRLEVALYADTARRHGVRLVAWDRPGSGRSDFQPDRTLLSVLDDARAVARSIGADRPVAIGHSGGGTHVLALASAGPDVVRAGVAINPGAPSDEATLQYMPKSHQKIIRAARERSWVFDLIGRSMEYRGSPRLQALLARGLDATDQQVLNSSELRPLFEAAAAEGALQPRAYTKEASLIWTLPWNFSLTTFAVPLHVYAGRADPFASFAQRLGRNGAVVHWFDGGHVSHLVPAVAEDLMVTTAAL